MRCNVNNQHNHSKNTSKQLHGMFCIKVQQKNLGIYAEANKYGLSFNWARLYPVNVLQKRPKQCSKY